MHAVDRNNFVGNGVANKVEPLPAAISVTPTLAMQAFGIFTEEQVLAPRLIVASGLGAGDLRGPAANEFRFVACRTRGN